MPTPLPELLTKVAALNSFDQPFVYAVIGSTINGTWNIVSGRYLDLKGSHSIHEDYSIDVTFDEKKGTFDFTETRHNSNLNAGPKGISGSKSVFVGKTSSKEFNFTLGGGGASQNPALNYSFETSSIKDPLFGLIEQNGWTQKKTFLGGLFRH